MIGSKRKYLITALLFFTIGLNMICSCTNQTAKPRECSISVVYQQEDYIPIYDYYIGVCRPLKSVIDRYDYTTVCIHANGTSSTEPFENTEYISFLHRLYKKRYEGAIAILDENFPEFKEEFFQTHSARVGGNTSDRIPLPDSSLVVDGKDYVLLTKYIPDNNGKVSVVLLCCDSQNRWDYIGEFRVDVEKYKAYNSFREMQMLSKNGDYLCICGDVWINTTSLHLDNKPERQEFVPFDDEMLIKSVKSYLIKNERSYVTVFQSWQIDQVNYVVFSNTLVNDNGKAEVAWYVSEISAEGQLLRLCQIFGIYDDNEPYRLETPFEIIPVS